MDASRKDKTHVKLDSGDTSVDTLDDLLSDFCRLDEVRVETIREFVDLTISKSRRGRVKGDLHEQ